MCLLLSSARNNDTIPIVHIVTQKRSYCEKDSLTDPAEFQKIKSVNISYQLRVHLYILSL